MMTLVHTLAVAEYLNFRHAANALGVAQSSVSVDVDIASIDIGSRENETELKSKAWFNAPAFPQARFSASQFKAKGNNLFEASGKLSIKGISREVVPYAVEGLLGELAQRSHVISEQGQGLDLFVDLDVIDAQTAERAGRRLRELLEALERRHKPA